MPRPLAVACLKWGNPYPAEYVNVLQRAVADHLSYAHRFVCVTDSNQGLNPGVEIIPLPEIPIERSKWASGFWPKLAIFKEGLFADDEIVLYLDVDILIAQSIDPFIDRINSNGGLQIIREWNPDIWRLLPVAMRPERGGNSSVIGFIAGQQRHLFSDFADDPHKIDEKYSIDQVYITERAKGRRYWPEGWCASFRRSCVPHWPLNLIWTRIKKKPWAKMFIFHGRPNPTEMIEDGNHRWGTKWRYGFGPVDWIQEYWRKYSA